MTKILPFTKDKLDEVLSIKVCKREVEELRALGRTDINQVIKESLEACGYSWYLKDEKGVRAVGGVCLDANYPETMGIIWLLVDERAFKDHLFTLNSVTYELLDICFNRLKLECLYNIVSPTLNKESVKWLEFIGFELSGEPKIGLDNKSEFRTFTMYREDYICAHQ